VTKTHAPAPGPADAHRARPSPAWHRLALLAGLAAPLLAWAQAGSAEGALDAETLQRLQALGQQAGAALAPGAVRVEIEPGRLDPRLRLAPCERIEPYLPAQVRVWGRSRVGLRCVQGPAAWNVSLPVTVKVFAAAWVLNEALPAGAVLQAAQLQQAEVDWAAAATPPLADLSRLLGRQLSRPLAAGAPVRVADLRQRQWFAAGETVQVLARGQGFSVSGEGQALNAGVEGQVVRVRTDNGRVLSGVPIGQNRVEVQL
jgi:flagella basal body P-ring formation protein FlgA